MGDTDLAGYDDTSASCFVISADVRAKADAGYPLESVDTSSPRATLTSFFAELEGTWEVFRDEYWGTPSYEIYLDIIHGAGWSELSQSTCC